MSKNRTALYLGGAIALGAILFMKRKALSDLASTALDAVNDAVFRAAIPSRAEPYTDVIRQVASETGIDPFLIVALGDQETRWGTARGSGGTTGPSIIGIDGTGHGLMQIDSGTWSAWLEENDWTDPYTNVKKGAEIFSSDLDYFASKGLSGEDQILAALAAYNHGPKNVWKTIQNTPEGEVPNYDHGTTGGNYGASVWGMFQNFSNAFAALLRSDSGENVA